MKRLWKRIEVTVEGATQLASDSGRWFMELAYLGRDFHGWQRQPGAMSVQQALEEGMQTILRIPVAVTGAGRTDAGVNARKMIAHFDAPSDHPLLKDEAGRQNLSRSLSSLLGPAIVVRRIWPVHSAAHARFDATSRTYRYYAHTERTPFSGGLSWLASSDLDFEAMNRAAGILLETSDFTSFSKLHTDAKTNICLVTKARWIQPYSDENPSQWYFEITADRFLRNMVRAVVGTLVDVGRGKLSEEGFRTVVEAKDRCAAGTSMPAGALFLHDITYPY